MAKTYNRGYTRFILLISIFVLVCPSALAADNDAESQVVVAQHTEKSADSPVQHEALAEEELLKQHKLTLAFGYTHIPEGADDVESDKGVWVPGLGLDYFYRLNEKWEIGIAADIEFGEYLIIDKDLNRKNAFILVALAGYELVPAWAVFAGGGIEIEEHKNLAVLRVGTEYEFQFENDWLIAPGLLFDLKEEFNSFSIYVAGGKIF
jgi:hypothetical protein